MGEASEIRQKDGLGLELAPGVRQETVLAPQLRASLRVLQMDWQTLASEVKHEAEVNPVVELEEPGDMSVVSDELKTAARDEELLPESPVEDESNPSVSIDEEAAERRQRFFDRQVATESLQEHLLAQIGAAGFTEEERPIAELIVGDIDDDGRYVGQFDELISVLGVESEMLTAILRRIQGFDPPGVAARDLRECLELQAQQIEATPDVRQVLLKIVADHLGDVARGDVAALAGKLEVSEETCHAALKALRRLEPKPGRPFLANGRHPEFIRPELEVEATAGGLSLTSCEHALPTLRISQYYRDMLSDKKTSQETRRYLRERIGSAEQLQEAIHRRGETILRVAEVVFSVQADFFREGFEALRPLTIEEVARHTGYHGTTVGRAVRGKYVRTPRGLFELRRFFCVGHLSEGDEAISAVSVKCRLADLVRTDEGVGMTDEELAESLGKAGLKISRRTVSKYRSELGIGSAAERVKERSLNEYA